MGIKIENWNESGFLLEAIDACTGMKDQFSDLNRRGSFALWSLGKPEVIAEPRKRRRRLEGDSEEPCGDRREFDCHANRGRVDVRYMPKVIAVIAGFEIPSTLFKAKKYAHGVEWAAVHVGDCLNGGWLWEFILYP